MRTYCTIVQWYTLYMYYVQISSREINNEYHFFTTQISFNSSHLKNLFQSFIHFSFNFQLIFNVISLCTSQLSKFVHPNIAPLRDSIHLNIQPAVHACQKFYCVISQFKVITVGRLQILHCRISECLF